MQHDDMWQLPSVPPPTWAVLLAALLQHGATTGFLDEDDDTLDPKKSRRRLRSGKPTQLTVGFMAGGRRITAVRCTDRKLRLESAEASRASGVDLAAVAGMPALVGEVELRLVLGVLATDCALASNVSILNDVLMTIRDVEKLLRTHKAKPWIGLAKHEPVYLLLDYAGVSPRLGRRPDVEE